MFRFAGAEQRSEIAAGQENSRASLLVAVYVCTQRPVQPLAQGDDLSGVCN